MKQCSLNLDHSHLAANEVAVLRRLTALQVKVNGDYRSFREVTDPGWTRVEKQALGRQLACVEERAAKDKEDALRVEWPEGHESGVLLGPRDTLVFDRTKVSGNDVT